MIKNNNNEILISIKDLSFKYAKKQNQHNLEIQDLEIPKDQIISLLGPSGSGKTTLLNLILGYLKPSSGTISIKNNPKIHEIAYIMQEGSIYENVSVFNNVFLSAKNYSKWVDLTRLHFLKSLVKEYQNLEKHHKIISNFNDYQIAIEQNKKWDKEIKYFKLILSLLFNKEIKNKITFLKAIRLKSLFRKEFLKIAKKLDIDQFIDKNVNQLSGGQKQRVSLAKAIIKKTNLVLMDEPFSALDAKIKESTIEWLIKIKKDFNLSIILVTHDQQDALKISDQIILLNDGKIQQFSDSKTMYNNPNNLFVAKFIGSPEINFIETKNDRSYYIRHNNLKVKANKSAEYTILDKKSFGDRTSYVVEFAKNNNWTFVLNNNNLNINDKVSITYDQKDVLCFDQLERRVYEKEVS
ncbi:ABC transporter ATP-binding protein [Mycoplasma putrefaciens]|uniref:Glycerol ABC transporter, ATP-binding protein n=2 Tax=Mycoplasma putrefaciens TaxID=2123 RepID=A0A7U3ZSX3_MYCPK|nr:ABC transporter ATP-binding protein [Mycoplasma putrefaciens]ACF32337.1 GtsA [Mycoplasma putrefaciens KS1]AEM68951.1 Glycerol ABC transporter, ATP-binding protein [Mycoplasma putrefaciens KS1]